LSARVTPRAANRDRWNDGFPPTATSIAAIRNGRFTSIPAGWNAQIAVIGDSFASRQIRS
jgi:hypothetical protein